MSWKQKLAKLTSILLIGNVIYQIVYSTILLIFVYPHLQFRAGMTGLILYESMIEKAIIYYISIVISGIYGVALFFKPKEQLTSIQIIGGLIIFFLTVFFVTKSSVTADPILDFIMGLIGK